MSKKRSDLEIYADILKVAKDGAKKSHIVYKANLNFKIVRKYLYSLEKNGLIEVPQEAKVFSTTEKGRKFINDFETFKEYVGSSNLYKY